MIKAAIPCFWRKIANCWVSSIDWQMLMFWVCGPGLLPIQSNHRCWMDTDKNTPKRNRENQTKNNDHHILHSLILVLCMYIIDGSRTFLCLNSENGKCSLFLAHRDTYCVIKSIWRYILWKVLKYTSISLYQIEYLSQIFHAFSFCTICYWTG